MPVFKGVPILGDLERGITDIFLGDWKMNRQADMADHAMNMSSAEAAVNRDWQTEMSNTAYQRQVADMKAAGINPMLAAMKGGGATTPSGGQGAGFNASIPDINLGQTAQTAAQIENIHAQTERTKAEQTEIEARTPTYAVSMENVRAQTEAVLTGIEKTIAETGFIKQQTETSATQRDLNLQNIQNLRAQLPQIDALVKQIKAQTTLTYADAKIRGIQGNLTEAQWIEAQQRISANLPKAEAALLEVRQRLANLQSPQAGMRAAVYSSPLGAFAEMMKALRQAIPYERSETTIEGK